VFWGDTHLHTSFSMDAGAFGARLGPTDAYQFARGDEIESSTAGRVRLARALDFLVVADHSDNMGFFPDLNAGAAHLLADPTGKEWYDKIQAGKGMEVALEIIDSFSRGTYPDAIMYYPDTDMYKSAWAKTIEAAEKYNDPGKFTAFIGYEWTSQVPQPMARRAARIRNTSGAFCRPLKTRPAVMSWPLPIMAICPTA
jgi:hypothetical protein